MPVEGRVSKSWNRMETWLTLLVGGVGLLLLLIAGLWVYMSATATPLHPTAESVTSVEGADPAARWEDAVTRSRQAARAHVAERNLPGLSVAVGVDGHLVWAEGFGWSDLEQHAPVEPRTRFRIGTMSIALTSAAAGLLVEQGRLNLDEEIQTYVPEYPKAKWPVTVRELMAHTSGLLSDGGDEGPLFGQHCDRPGDALPVFAGRELLFEPGTQYRYSRFGWIVVSAAIESAADEPFLTFMSKAVFAPLGMDDTGADSSIETAAEGRASSYFPRFAADPRYGPDPMRPLDLSCYSGSSIFVSTPSDLVRFAMAVNGGTFLKPATVEMLQASQRLPSGQDTGYGLGWDLETVDVLGKPTVTVGHDGDLLGGIAASLMTFKDRGLVVAVVSNISYADTPTLARRIAEAFAE